ncbi:MAG: ribonuclease domain-containing protein [Sterolibacterium sp.]|nr:ribonuclease domain-containing protein [Sterolibacterium sp.]
MRKLVLWLLVLGLIGNLAGCPGSASAVPLIASINIAELPREASVTLRLIERGGPFPHRRDGVVFVNHEKHLPIKPRGTYHEYTVPTPGLRGRGARRIIASETGEYYYTDDHYRSFRKISE